MYADFVDEVMRRARIEERQEAERAIRVTLEALSRRLCDIDARAVAEQLPEPLARRFVDRGVGGDRFPSSDAIPLEHRRAVCRLLAETLDEQGRTHLRMQPLVPLFAAPGSPDPNLRRARL